MTTSGNDNPMIEQMMSGPIREPIGPELRMPLPKLLNIPIEPSVTPAGPTGWTSPTPQEKVNRLMNDQTYLRLNQQLFELGTTLNQLRDSEMKAMAEVMKCRKGREDMEPIFEIRQKQLADYLSKYF